MNHNMPDKGEPIGQEDQPLPPEQTQEGKVEITQEYLDYLREIARSVSGNPKMGFELGTAGHGSKAFLFDAEHQKIVIDPEHIKERGEGIFVLAHEAAHVFMTIGPKELGLTPEMANRLFGQTGFGYINNAVEDCAISDFQENKFIHLGDLINANYDKSFTEENANLWATMPGSEEDFLVREYYQRTGNMPRFIQYGSEIMRDWHAGKFSQKLDAAVQAALKKTIKPARESIATIPDAKEANRRNIVKVAQKRFKLVAEKIWPEAKKLVEMDLHTEELRQMAQELMDKLRELAQKQQEKQQAQHQGDSKKAEEITKEMEQVKKEIGDLGGEFSPEVAKELTDLAEAMTKEMESGAQQQDQGEQEQEGGQQQDDAGTEGQPGTPGDQAQENGQESGDAKPADFPLPEDKLSEKAKKELEEKFEKLSKEKKQELRQKAQQGVQDLEDKLNEERQGKLNQDKPESHAKQQERQEQEQQEKEEEQQQKEQEKKEQKEQQKKPKPSKEDQEREAKERKDRQEKLEEEMLAKQRENMPRFQRVMEEIEPQRDELYKRLKDILRPEEFSGLESGHPRGKILNPQIAMQGDAQMEMGMDPTKYQEMWDDEYEPVKTDNRIVSLIDLSGSMQGDRINEAEKGVDTATSALDKLEDVDSGIKNAVIGYHRRVFHYKKMNQRLNEEVQRGLSTMPERTDDDDAGTDTFYGITEALKELSENLGTTGNFILNFTDGQSSNAEELKALLTEGKQERKLKKIKVGLIWIGRGLNEEQLRDMVQEYGYDFGLVMPATKLSDEEKEAGKKDFATGLADLLEDIVKNPDKY